MQLTYLLFCAKCMLKEHVILKLVHQCASSCCLYHVEDVRDTGLPKSSLVIAFVCNLYCSVVEHLQQLQVESEMRELLSIMEQQKAASAAKVKQLATILHDMQSAGA